MCGLHQLQPWYSPHLKVTEKCLENKNIYICQNMFLKAVYDTDDKGLTIE